MGFLLSILLSAAWVDDAMPRGFPSKPKILTSTRIGQAPPVDKAIPAKDVQDKEAPKLPAVDVPKFTFPDQAKPLFKGASKEPEPQAKTKEQEKKEPPKFELRVTENEALAIAGMDLRTLSSEQKLFTRYIWITDGDIESLQEVSLALNRISRGPIIVRPLPLGKDKLMVLRVNLRAYAPTETDINDWLQTWEEFQYDPRFSLLITKDTLRFALGEVKGKSTTVQKDVPVLGKKDDPQTVRKSVDVKVDKAAFDDVDLIRIPSEHINATVLAELMEGTQSQAPVVSHSYFVTRALAQIQEKGIAKKVYGGLYYAFAGIKKGAKKGTDEDNFFESLGIGNVAQGITAAKLFDNLRSDSRVALFRSGVTGRPRRVDVFRTLIGRVDGSQSIVSVTHDLKAADIDIGQHPLLNLLDFQDAAREVIYEKANGLHGFVLFDGKGALQDEVPPDVATDHTIPPPHGARLQPAIGCIRCHGSEGGWRVLRNDVPKLVGGNFDIYGDLSGGNLDETIVRLAGLYAGDLELSMLPRARDDYARNILKATGAWQRSKDQTDIVKLSGEKTADIWARYKYDLVHAQEVCRDLGHLVSREEAPAKLRELVKRPGVQVDGITPEDPRIAALMQGLEINRTDYDFAYSFIATRHERTKK